MRTDVFTVNNGSDVTLIFYAHAILVTHHHRDHLDARTISELKKPSTKVFASKECRIGIIATPGDVIEYYKRALAIPSKGETGLWLSADFWGYSCLYCRRYRR